MELRSINGKDKGSSFQGQQSKSVFLEDKSSIQQNSNTIKSDSDNPMTTSAVNRKERTNDGTASPQAQAVGVGLKCCSEGKDSSNDDDDKLSPPIARRSIGASNIHRATDDDSTSSVGDDERELLLSVIQERSEYRLLRHSCGLLKAPQSATTNITTAVPMVFGATPLVSSVKSNNTSSSSPNVLPTSTF